MSPQPTRNPNGLDADAVFLIDGGGYIYRAYHAIRSLRNARGLPTNAVFGFTRMLLKLIEDRRPRFMAIFFDAAGPTFRHDLYPAYKANRPPMPEDLSVQIPYIKKITRAFNLPCHEQSGFEADDLIGTAVRQALASGYRVVIVSGDKDLKQLVSDRAILYDPMNDRLTTAADIKATGINPLQLIDVMGLSGDATDNVPGVPGVGPKTALDLVKTYGGVENLYRHIAEIKKPKLKQNLCAYRDQALLSKQLVTIECNVPMTFEIQSFKSQQPDAAALSRLFQELEFRQLQKRFFSPAGPPEKDYRCVDGLPALKELAARLQKADIISVDTETTSVHPMRAALVGFSFAVSPHEAFYIPCGHTGKNGLQQIPLEQAVAHLKPVLENAAVKKVGQNIKYDWIVLARHGIRLAGVVFDTMLASYLLNPLKRGHSLDQIALDFLGHQTITYEALVGKGSKNIGFDQVPIEKAVPYACEDADITLLAFQTLRPEIEKNGLTRLLETVELPLVSVLVKMEMTGIGVDPDMLKRLSRRFEDQLAEIENDIYQRAGERFNINSPQQLGRILFEKLQLPTQKKTRKKTSYSTDIEVLTSLAGRHELPALVLRQRTLAKLKSTYVDALLDLVHPQTGRIHTSFNQTVTATGRLSSSDPNLQNIPIRTDEGREIRRAFVPGRGCVLLSADYSQVELRILAHCSEDPILIRAFHEDEDIHTRTAVEVFQVAPEQITPELRRQAKVINFGIIYGMSPFGLSKSLGISQQMAKTYIGHYFDRYSGVKAYIDRIIAEARQNECTSTLMGRTRRLPDINARNPTVRGFAERTAINTPIQGTAADLIKIAMIEVDRALTEKGLKTTMLLSVHDEMVFEVPHQERPVVERLVADCMENVWRLKVPLRVNIAAGDNWSDAH